MKPEDKSLAGKLGISADALFRLGIYESMIRKWSHVKNLVSANSLPDLWGRHILDSAQVQRLVPDAEHWADLGSGGGFPGIVTAILLAEREGAHVHLVESDNRKCAFLRAVSRETGVKATVHHGRIEHVVPTLQGIEAVSARALAQLDQLVEWAEPLLKLGAVGVFPKGKSVQNELTRISMDSRFCIDVRPSISQSEGAIVLVRRDPSHGAEIEHS